MPTVSEGDILRVCSDLDLPCDPTQSYVPLPFIGRGNIWINDSLDEDTVQLARTIIERALMETACGQLTIVGYDSALTGVFAPFSALSEGEQRLLNIITTQEELARNLGYASDQIRSTQDVIRGMAPSLLEYRRQTASPIGSYELIVLACDMDALSDDIRATLRRLMRRGVAYGVSFLVISPIADEEPAFYVRNFASQTTRLLDAFDGQYRVQSMAEKDPCRIRYTPARSEDIVCESERLMRAAQTAAVPNVSFESLHAAELQAQDWTRSSADGITFCVGLYGIEPMEITLGDELNQRHNALITGAVGQGKSNLIQVIIHSLCSRYGPDELKLYLLDFKEGVTFKAYARSKDGWLPHARTLGLESDVAFGQAVLERLMTTYKRRLSVLKQYGCTSINQLRRRRPEVAMPRILVVIDEFQMMFGDAADRAKAIVDALEKSVRLFRAAGIHFILASQTIGGNIALANAQESIFAQVPVRIALKNSLVESLHTLGHDNPQAAFLRPHEAIVNLDYGAPAQNKRTVIAFADEGLLAPLRHAWWERARSSTPPYVFEGAARAHVSSALDAIEHSAETTAKRAPEAYLGELISVDGSKLAVPLADEPGGNICVIGTPEQGCDTASGVLQAAALSLAAQLRGREARFICCDACERDALYGELHPVFAAAMEEFGHPIESVGPDDLSGALKAALEGASRKVPVYAVLAHMDGWKAAQDSDPFAFTSEDPLKAALTDGPSRGLHVIGHWVRLDALTGVLMSPRDAFNTTVCLRVDPRSVQEVSGSFTEWVPQDNRALAIDYMALGGSREFIPYVPLASAGEQAPAAASLGTDEGEE